MNRHIASSCLILLAWALSATMPVMADAAAAPASPRSGDASSAEEDADKQRYRLLPIPILITEPAIGEGLGVALTLFHPVKQGKLDENPVATPDSLLDASGRREAPPVVTAVAAAYTNNDTWLAGIFHNNNWRDDSIRYTGALGATRVNSRVYLLNAPLSFSMDAAFTFQEFKFRLGGSDLLLGAGFAWMDADNRFGLNLPRVPDLPDDPAFAIRFRNVGVEAKLTYETRDNSMNPTRGQLAEVALWRFDESLGGDYDYWVWKLRALSFHPLAERWTLGLRLDVSGIDGAPPFFAYPYVKLRGIPSLRYQDRIAGAAEVELRYRVAPRWEVSAFGGIGRTSDRVPLFNNPDSIYNFGIGGRFKALQAHNVWIGVDIARGPEDRAWYIQVGHPW